MTTTPHPFASASSTATTSATRSCRPRSTSRAPPPSCTASPSTGSRCRSAARALTRTATRCRPKRWTRCKTLDGWILGPIGHRAYPKGPNAINPHPILRKQFNLFANVRPTRSYPDIGCLHDDVDLVIVRENNEGFQPDRNMLLGIGRVPAHRRGDAVGARDHPHRQPPRRARRLRARAPAPQAPDLRAQGHGVQARLRHVRRGVPEARARISRTCASTT